MPTLVHRRIADCHHFKPVKILNYQAMTISVDENVATATAHVVRRHRGDQIVALQAVVQ